MTKKKKQKSSVKLPAEDGGAGKGAVGSVLVPPWHSASSPRRAVPSGEGPRFSQNSPIPSCLCMVVIHPPGIAQRELKVSVSFQPGPGFFFLRSRTPCLCLTASEPWHEDYFLVFLSQRPSP